MADANAMKRCASIVRSDSDKRVIVVSATSGTTNLLTDMILESSSDKRRELVKTVRKRHLAICHEANLKKSAVQQVESILEELDEEVTGNKIMSPMLMDRVLAFGERLSSTIFAEILRLESGQPVKWCDARTFMKTDSQYGNAEPDIEAISEMVETELRPAIRRSTVVTQGFIASDGDGKTTTLGRGGSDYSAALIAEALDADVLEIWTDVTAIYTTDPGIYPGARPITEISFDEAAELSVFGAKVLHPATMVPAIRKNIRVYVGSSIHPEKPGTWIVNEAREQPVIRAISIRRNQTLVKVHSLDMLHRYGFLSKLFQVLAEHRISVDLVTTSEVSVALTLDTNAGSSGNQKLSPEAIEELKTFSEVEIERGLSLVALVGNNLNETAGLSGPVFGALENINIHLICHGASSHNLCFLVAEEEAEDVIRVLHKKFIS